MSGEGVELDTSVSHVADTAAGVGDTSDNNSTVDPAIGTAENFDTDFLEVLNHSVLYDTLCEILVGDYPELGEATREQRGRNLGYLEVYQRDYRPAKKKRYSVVGGSETNKVPVDIVEFVTKGYLKCKDTPYDSDMVMARLELHNAKNFGCANLEPVFEFTRALRHFEVLRREYQKSNGYNNTLSIDDPQNQCAMTWLNLLLQQSTVCHKLLSKIEKKALPNFPVHINGYDRVSSKSRAEYLKEINNSWKAEEERVGPWESFKIFSGLLRELLGDIVTAAQENVARELQAEEISRQLSLSNWKKFWLAVYRFFAFLIKKLKSICCCGTENQVAPQQNEHQELPIDKKYVTELIEQELQNPETISMARCYDLYFILRQMKNQPDDYSVTRLLCNNNSQSRQNKNVQLWANEHDLMNEFLIYEMKISKSQETRWYLYAKNAAGEIVECPLLEVLGNDFIQSLENFKSDDEFNLKEKIRIYLGHPLSIKQLGECLADIVFEREYQRFKEDLIGEEHRFAPAVENAIHVIEYNTSCNSFFSRKNSSLGQELKDNFYQFVDGYLITAQERIKHSTATGSHADQTCTEIFNSPFLRKFIDHYNPTVSSRLLRLPFTREHCYSEEVKHFFKTPDQLREYLNIYFPSKNSVTPSVLSNSMSVIQGKQEEEEDDEGERRSVSNTPC